MEVESFTPTGPGPMIKHGDQPILPLRDDNFQARELPPPNDVLRLCYCVFKGKGNLLAKDGSYDVPKELRDRNSFATVTVTSRQLLWHSEPPDNSIFDCITEYLRKSMDQGEVRAFAVLDTYDWQAYDEY